MSGLRARYGLDVNKRRTYTVTAENSVTNSVFIRKFFPRPARAVNGRYQENSLRRLQMSAVASINYENPVWV